MIARQAILAALLLMTFNDYAQACKRRLLDFRGWRQTQFLGGKAPKSLGAWRGLRPPIAARCAASHAPLLLPASGSAGAAAGLT